VNTRYLNFMREQLGDGVEFFGQKDTPLSAIVVKKGGKVAGLLMPVKTEAGYAPDIAGMRASVESRRAAIPQEYVPTVRKAISSDRLSVSGLDAVEKLVKDGAFDSPRELDTFLRLHPQEVDGATLARDWEVLGNAVRAIEVAKALVRKKNRTLLDEELIARAKAAEKELLQLSKARSGSGWTDMEGIVADVVKDVGAPPESGAVTHESIAIGRSAGHTPGRTARALGIPTIPVAPIPRAMRIPQPSTVLPEATVPQVPSGTGMKSLAKGLGEGT